MSDERRDDDHVDVMQTIAESGRAALRALWERRDERESLKPEERRLLELLERHKQFRPFWDGADPEPGTNPFLHVHYHVAVAEQVASGAPPEAKAALERLVAAGVDPHEAEHKVMEALILEFYDMLKRRGPFDQERYRRRLAEFGCAV
ncbi:DUF1841 family protein [bacterium]|nr:DUF1841 family protein [bacterium]